MNEPSGDLAAMPKGLRIAVIAHALRDSGGRSVGRNLVAALGRLAPDNSYLITIPAGAGYEKVCALIPGCQIAMYDHSRSRWHRWWYERRELPRQIAAFRPSVVLSLANYGLVHPPAPQAVLCQDAHLFYPWKNCRRDTLMHNMVMFSHRRHFARQLRRTQVVFCQTAAARDRLANYCGYKGKLVICPNAVSDFTRAGAEQATEPPTLARFADKTKLFCLTRYAGHKNLESLVRLFRRHGDSLRDVVVVITVAAGQHPYARRLLRSIKRHGLQDSIINAGPLLQTDLAGYFRHCQALFLPTLLESFSGTYLEAMHFGLPILTSNRDFAEVVCGDAALYFDPLNAESMRDAILRLKSDQQLARELVDKGRKRLESYFISWDEVAARMLVEVKQIARGR